MIQQQGDEVMQTVLDSMERSSRMTALLDPRTVNAVHSEGRAEELAMPQTWATFVSEHIDFLWVIGLHKLGDNVEPTGLRLNQDVMLGRGGTTSQPSSLDLSTYGAQERGVSRLHAMLRPTRRKLFIIDMQSTNGTQVNAHPLGPSTARALESNDIISLGDLTFIVKVYTSPLD